jgi:DNA-binding transcriptional ArsR family regulator
MNMTDYEAKSEILQMLSHPVRLQILDELRRREACVCHLQAVTGRPQAYVSQQLRFLREAGLVKDVKDGQNVFYHLTNETVRTVLKDVFGEPEAPSVLPGCTCPFCSGDRG